MITIGAMAAPRTAEVEPLGHPEPLTAEGLLDLPQQRLDEVFRAGTSATIPVGRGSGSVIIKPGRQLARVLNTVLTAIFWRGKRFTPATQDLKNLVSPFAVPAIRAKVYKQASWYDGAECVVLDYSKTSFVAGWIRDEIREVSPGLYLGLVYGVGRLFGGRRRIAGFALTFGPGGGRSEG